MTFDRLKKLIENGNYVKEDLLNKMDIFLLCHRITNENYQELLKMMEE